MIALPTKPAPKAEPQQPPSPPVLPPKPEPTSESVFPPELPETHLVKVGGKLAGSHRWRFSGRMLTVGASEDNDVVIDLPQISGHHAKFDLFPSGAVYVTDLASSNGTWVDGKRLTPHAREEVKPGQRVALSRQLIVEVQTKPRDTDG